MVRCPRGRACTRQACHGIKLRKITLAMIEAPDRIQEYLKRLMPLARGNLLIELERLEVCGSEIPGSADILARLRAEFRS